MDSVVKKCEDHEQEKEEIIPSDFSLLERRRVVGQYKKLRALHKLQKKMVRKNMHDAMSPISAISGYLELMNLTLDQDADVERIERYRQKIKSGIHELNTIIEQLHDRFSEEDEMAAFNSAVVSEEIDSLLVLDQH